MTDINKLKLFVWTGFCPDWSGGLAFAIAETETEAQEMVVKEYGLGVYEWGELEITPIAKYARCVSGGS